MYIGIGTIIVIVVVVFISAAVAGPRPDDREHGGSFPRVETGKGSQHGRSAYQLHSSGGWQITKPGHQQANDVHIHGQDCKIRDKHRILGG
jgi:hypothetical protein